jgi:spermidine/putrescine transport system permease protein
MRELAYGFLLTPLVAPGIIIGFALLMISRKVLGLSLSLITIGAGHVLLCIPLAMLVIIPRLEGLDRSYEEASMDLGEAEWGTFRRVVFPLALPAIVASLFLTFVTSLDEFILAFFLGGNEATLPLYIYGQLRFPDRLPRVLALGSCILVFSSLLILVAEWLSRRSVSNRGTLEHLA